MISATALLVGYLDNILDGHSMGDQIYNIIVRSINVRKIHIFMLIGCGLTLMMACELFGQPIQKVISTNSYNLKPENEILAYLIAQYSEDYSSVNLAINLTNPENAAWKVCLTCEIAGETIWDPSGSTPYRIAWSPDHLKIAFLAVHSENEKNILDLHIATSNGIVKLIKSWVTQSFPEPLAWSPDNQNILVVFKNEEYDTGLHFVNTTNGMEEYLMVERGAFPVWLNEQTIAFIRDRGKGEIYTMKLNDPEPNFLTQLNIYMDIDYAPLWSPAGNKLIVTGSPRNEGWGTYVMDMEGAVKMKLKVGDENPNFTSWSPDGQKILFFSRSDDEGASDLYSIDVGTWILNRLTNSPDQEISPSWSPYGYRIAYYKNDGIYVMNADGTDERLVVPLPDDATVSLLLSDFLIPIWK